MNQEDTLSIGKIAKSSNVRIDTIRYYETNGLIPKPKRSESGYRLFSENTVDRIHFIKKAQTLGFTLKEIKELLSLKANSKKSCSSVKVKAQVKMKEIKEKITVLENIYHSLNQLMKQCDSTLPISECPILDSMTPELLKNKEQI